LPRFLLSAAIVVVAVMAQIVGDRAAAPLGLDFLVLPVVFMSLRRGSEVGAGWGFVCGLCHDMVGGGVLGAHAFGKALAGGLLGRLSHRFDRNSPLLQALATAAGALVSTSAAVLLRTALGAEGSLLSTPLLRIGGLVLATTVSSAVIGPPGFWALVRLSGWRYRDGEGKWRFYA